MTATRTVGIDSPYHASAPASRNRRGRLRAANLHLARPRRSPVYARWVGGGRRGSHVDELPDQLRLEKALSADDEENVSSKVSRCCTSAKRNWCWIFGPCSIACMPERRSSSNVMPGR